MARRYEFRVRPATGVTFEAWATGATRPGV